MLIKILVFIGTRPEAIKMAPLVKELRKNSDFKVTVLLSGQHQQMVASVLDIFSIKPDLDLNIFTPNQSMSQAFAKIISGVDQYLHSEEIELMLVHGDTLTCSAGAMAAFFNQVPVGHIEAGLRTHDNTNPFPEEVNRVFADQVSEIYFAPTKKAANNLIEEGKREENIFVTGNTGIDALKYVAQLNSSFQDKTLQTIDFSRKILLVTTHRRESFGTILEGIHQALKELVERNTDVEIVFPVHPNPNVRTSVEILKSSNRIHLVEPVSYLDMVNLMKKCYFIMTDSGGIQEEAPSLGKPVLVLRTTTERPEGIEAGTSRLVGVKKENILKEAGKLLDDKYEYQTMSQAQNPYGDGKASDRIVKILSDKYGSENKEA